ncbi:MAG: hypothetical protein ACERJ1_09330 [Halodesulfovibrio sp.]|uniref:hypothetical protein n=1 Tax=Halodesulfovibrio sp. TaxID=1912772 RepID=UPI00359EBB31
MKQKHADPALPEGHAISWLNSFIFLFKVIGISLIMSLVGVTLYRYLPTLYLDTIAAAGSQWKDYNFTQWELPLFFFVCIAAPQLHNVPRRRSVLFLLPLIYPAIKFGHSPVRTSIHLICFLSGYAVFYACENLTSLQRAKELVSNLTIALCLYILCFLLVVQTVSTPETFFAPTLVADEQKSFWVVLLLLLIPCCMLVTFYKQAVTRIILISSFAIFSVWHGKNIETPFTATPKNIMIRQTQGQCTAKLKMSNPDIDGMIISCGDEEIQQTIDAYFKKKTLPRPTVKHSNLRTLI